MTVLAVFVGWGCWQLPAGAAVTPHALFGDGAVLQQGAKVPVWGTADPGEKVTVRFQDQEVSATAKGGKWRVELQNLKAGGPFEMTIRGTNTVQLKDILVGEVWVCSGQSNMEWSVGGCDKTDKDYAFSAPHNKMLRLFQVQKSPRPRPTTQTSGQWVEADPKAIGNWTAVGYFFGRDLRQHVQV